MAGLTSTIIDQRTTVYNSYLLMVGDEDKYTIFKTADIADATGVDMKHVSASISKCIQANLIKKVGKEGRAGLYKLTDHGINRGEYYFQHWNPITNEMTY